MGEEVFSWKINWGCVACFVNFGQKYVILTTFLSLEASFSKTNGINREKIPDLRLLLYFRAKQLKTIPNV